MSEFEPSITWWLIGAIALYTGLFGIRCSQRVRRRHIQRQQWQAWHDFQQLRQQAAKLNSHEPARHSD